MVLSNLRLDFCSKQTEIYISSAFTRDKHDMKYINGSPRDSREIYNKDLILLQALQPPRNLV